MTKYHKRHRIIATFFLLIFFPTLLPNNLFASNNGPVAPEAASFEPIDASDMVNLATGDMSYVLPVLNVPSPEGGYPLALAYHAGIATDQEASWVGLGWNLNPGAINRSVNGYPDDWSKTEVSEFFYDKGGVQDTYNFSIGGTLPNGITLGLGASWGSNRAFGGSVTLGYGGFAATVNEKGSITGLAFGGLSISQSGISYGVGASSGNVGVGLSYNFTNSSASLTAGLVAPIAEGYNLKMASTGISLNTKTGGTSVSSNYGGKSSTQNTSSGDYDVSVKSNNTGIDLGIFWFGYGHSTLTYYLRDLNVFKVSGSLYPYHYKKDEIIPASSILNTNYRSDFRDDVLPECQSSNIYIDSGLEIPVYKNSASIQLNDYDYYNVNSQGLSGEMGIYSSEERLLSTGRLYYDSPTVDYSFDLNQKLNFYFKNSNSSFFRVNDGEFLNNPNAPSTITNDVKNGNLTGFNRTGNNYSKNITPNGDVIKVGNRMRDGNFIQVFTNSDIISGNAPGFIEAKGIARNSDVTYTEEQLGIGAYQITTLDGKTYHYSLPVYEYETYSKNFKDATDENKNFLESSKERKYATHWLLTAVTGSDYFDTNQNGKVDAADYGYWVEFEYGKWSDGYAWRSPHSGYKGIPDREGNTVSYSYFWGRKQIFYLDAVRTRTHTALFVKKLRKDNNSTVFNTYTAKINSPGEFNRSTKCIQYGAEQLDKPIDKEKTYFRADGSTYKAPANISSLYGRQTSFKYVDIPKNYSLALDKILLLKNEDALNINKDNGTLTSTQTGYSYNGLGYTNVKGRIGVAVGSVPDLFNNIAAVKSFQTNLHANVLDNKDIQNLQLESKSLKCINFSYNYELAKNSDNSEDANKGRLTLKEVEFTGKKATKILPSFKFEYHDPNVNYDNANRDVWGYNKTNPVAWSLKNIKTPIGSIIKINYESDSYRRDAVSERLKSIPYKIAKTYRINDIWSGLEIQTLKKKNNLIEITLDPLQYAWKLERLTYKGAEVFIDYDTGVKTIRDKYTVDSFSKISGNLYSITLKETDETLFHSNFLDTFYTSPKYSATEYQTGSKLVYFRIEIPSDFGTDPDPTNPNYKAEYANGSLGGGIRVKDISVLDANSSKEYSKVEYSYRNPFSNKISGITSYTPFDIYKMVPMTSLLPSPGVMYEYVTVVNKGSDNTILDKTLYQFNVLKPNNTVFHKSSVDVNPLLYVEKFNFGKFLKAYAYNYNYSVGPVSYNTAKIENRIGDLGTIKSITNFNHIDQIKSNQTYSYKANLNEDGQIGVKENSNNTISNSAGTLVLKHLSITDYPSVLESIATTKNNSTTVTENLKYDFLTGQVLEVKSKTSDGKIFKTRTVPAYIKYSGMGSKVDNINNKNMLSQVAANYSYIFDNNNWKETGVGITTWSNLWAYKDISGNTVPATIEKEKIWRKHKTYSWNGSKDNNGIFINYDRVSTSGDDNFNWALPSAVGVNVVQPAQWKQTGEVTLYDHYSSTLETKDINGNYSSIKMGDNDTKVITAGNGGYGEIFFTGGENTPPINFSNYLEPEITMTNTSRNNSYYHTGNYSIAATSNSNFGVSMKNGQHRSGRYKVSVWVEKTNADKARINNNGTIINFSESYTAGNWVLKNGYVNISTSATAVYVTSADSSTVYFDDLMIRPAACSITGYVYNEWDELTYIIGNNGMATKFEYDTAGRLVKTYTEVIDDSGNGISGGFKLSKSNTYNNKFLNK